jgi:glycosyltransferase involved in cell wall biosynthesis
MGIDRMQPLISIVTPSFNHAAFIEKTILSVLDQDYPQIEYIVMDGGSTDGTLDILEKYGDRLTWVSEPDKGQSDAINKGFRMASGEILTWLNCDDVYLPGAVRTAVQFLAEHPNVAMAYGGANYKNDAGELIKRGRSVNFDPSRPCETIIPQPAAFFRKRAFEEAGELDIDLHYRMDLDLWVRMALKFKINAIPYILVDIRTSLDTKTSSLSERHWSELALIGQRYGLAAITPEYILKERALKYYYRGIVLYQTGHAREARAELLESIKLNALVALALSFLGAGLIPGILKLRMYVHNRRSNLRPPSRPT